MAGRLKCWKRGGRKIKTKRKWWRKDDILVSVVGTRVLKQNLGDRRTKRIIIYDENTKESANKKAMLYMKRHDRC